MKTLTAGLLTLTMLWCPSPLTAEETGLTRALSSQIASGWTSNGEQRAGGGADFFITQQHRLTLSGMGDGMALRGSVSFTDTRFLRLDVENDSGAALDLLGEMALGHGVLRGSFALSYSQEGKAIGPVGSGIGSTTLHWTGRLGLETQQQFGPASVTLGADYAQSHYGESRFSGLMLPPQRSKAHVGIVGVYGVVQHALDEHLGILARLRLQRGVIAERDRMVFGRHEATGLRLGAGLAANLPMRAGFLLEGGVDMVFPHLTGVDPILLPYGQGRLEVVLGEAVTLEAGFKTDTRMNDPLDGLAEWIIEGRAGAFWRVSPELGLRAGLFAGAVRSVGFDIGTERHWGGELGLETALAERVSLAGSVSHKHVSGLEPDSAETRLSLAVQATL